MAYRKVLKDGSLLAGSQLLSLAAVFGRTIILARLISKSDMGVAVLFQTTVFLFDMLSDLNLGTFLVQSVDGDFPKVQRTAQVVTALRGAALALIIFMLARPAVYLFEVPQALWAFQLLAVLPLLKGLLHLDMNRLQRHTRYGPSIIADAVPQLFCLAVAYPLCRWLHDYSVMLWLLILQYALSTALSHVTAERAYRWSLDGQSAKSMLRFGWPLLINGLLMFATFQGDRVIIGAQRMFPAYTKDDLGVYSVAFSLTLVPSMILAKIVTSLLLPRMARVQDIAAAFQRHVALALEGLAIAAGLLAILFMVAGGFLIVKFYGEKYVGASVIIVWLGVMQSIRIIRVGTTLAAMAKGDTHNSMVSNIARLMGVAGAIVAAIIGARPMWIAAAGCFGEGVALAVSSFALVRRHQLPVEIIIRTTMISGLGIGLGLLARVLTHGAVSDMSLLLIWIMVSLIFIVFALSMCKSLRAELLSFIHYGAHERKSLADLASTK